MNYLLDTNVCIALICGLPPSARLHLGEARRAGAEICRSAIVLLELWHGALNSSRQEPNCAKVETFLAGPVSIVPFDEDDARTSAAVRAELESTGRPVGAYDLLMAGQALRREPTLVTANTREFARVKGLLWEDWAK